MKNFKFMMVLFVMIAALCFTACESDKDDESTVPAPTCDPACTGDTECKCEADKCECVDKIEKEDLKPEDCKCDPACTDGKVCKCEGDKKECTTVENQQNLSANLLAQKVKNANVKMINVNALIQ